MSATKILNHLVLFVVSLPSPPLPSPFPFPHNIIHITVFYIKKNQFWNPWTQTKNKYFENWFVSATRPIPHAYICQRTRNKRVWPKTFDPNLWPTVFFFCQAETVYTYTYNFFLVKLWDFMRMSRTMGGTVGWWLFVWVAHWLVESFFFFLARLASHILFAKKSERVPARVK